MVFEMRKFMSADADSFFSGRHLSYRTPQEVLITDFWLGFTERAVSIIVLIVVFAVLLVYGEGYYRFEDSFGPVTTAVSGDALGVGMGSTVDSRYFSTEDLTSSFLEVGNVFIATKVMIQEQRRGVCEDAGLPCSSTEECTPGVGAVCSENGLCVEPSWCPVPGHEQFQSYKVSSQDMRIWVKSGVSFPDLENKVYTTDYEKPVLFPAHRHNTFTVRNFLLMCNPPVRFEEISELGAAIEVQIKWDCIVGNIFGCKPKPIKVRRIDVLLDSEDIGFKFKYSEMMGPDHRELQRRSGIRLYFKSIGHGQIVDLAEITLKLSMGLSLLGFAKLVTDFIMLKLVRKKRYYHARKYAISPDFSDYLKKLGDENLIDVTKLLDDDADEWAEEKAMAEDDQDWAERMQELAD